MANADSLLATRSITQLQLHPGIAFKAWYKECCVLAAGWSDFEQERLAKKYRHVGRCQAHIAEGHATVISIISSDL
jgi:hypothetical protein